MKKWIAAVLACAMMLSLAACGGSSTGDSSSAGDSNTTQESSSSESASSGEATESGDKDTTVAVGTTASYLYFNTEGANQGDTYGTYLLYDLLFDVDPDTSEFYSPVSDDWGWDDDTTLRITVKDGIYFSDGCQMTAADILSTMEYATTWGNQNSGKWEGVVDFDSTYLSDDGMTIYIKYYSVYGAALSEMLIAVQDKEFMDNHDDSDEAWWTAPVGSGAYEVENVVSGSSVTYKLREDYWDTSKSFDCTEITVNYYSDATTMWVDYQNGVIDVVLGLDDTQVKALEDGTVEGTLVKQSTNNVAMMVMNVNNNEALADINVRKAIAYAVDWDAVAEIAWGSLASHATSHFASTMSCYTSHELEYTYDPDTAKQILADAGYSDGDISIMYVAVNETQQNRVMEAVQGYLMAVGINVETLSTDLNTALPDYYFVGADDMAILMANGANNSRDAWQVLSATYNVLFIDRHIYDDEYIALCDKSLASTNQADRDAAYAEIDDWLYENYMMIPYCEIEEAWCFNSRIASLDMLNVGYSTLGNIKLA